LCQKITKNTVESRDIFDGQARDRVHIAALCFCVTGGSAGTATGGGAVFGAAVCLLHLCRRVCESAVRDAKTFCPVLEMTSKLWVNPLMDVTQVRRLAAQSWTVVDDFKLNLATRVVNNRHKKSP